MSTENTAKTVHTTTEEPNPETHLSETLEDTDTGTLAFTAFSGAAVALSAVLGLLLSGVAL